MPWLRLPVDQSLLALQMWVKVAVGRGTINWCVAAMARVDKLPGSAAAYSKELGLKLPGEGGTCGADCAICGSAAATFVTALGGFGMPKWVPCNPTLVSEAFGVSAVLGICFCTGVTVFCT